MINRTNMILRQAESWRPLAFRADSGTLSRVHFALRRFLDLQTASIWQDLRRELPRVEGAVVDVGCGGGILAEAMAERGASVLGIDLAERCLELLDLRQEGGCWFRVIIHGFRAPSLD